MKIVFDDVKASTEISAYLLEADKVLSAVGYTEHSFAHATKCVQVSSALLKDLGYGADEVEMVKIAAYMHDIGNVVNRWGHAQSGALLASRLLSNLGLELNYVLPIVSAIGYHDESTAYPVSAIAAALILADKTDVRRSRVRDSKTIVTDIHDRVNYAVTHSKVLLNKEEKTFSLILTIDLSICSVMDYFEIFLQRMLLCRQASEFFHLRFTLSVNGQELM